MYTPILASSVIDLTQPTYAATTETPSLVISEGTVGLSVDNSSSPYGVTVNEPSYTTQTQIITEIAAASIVIPIEIPVTEITAIINLPGVTDDISLTPLMTLAGDSFLTLAGEPLEVRQWT
jgi:hypothetical protein